MPIEVPSWSEFSDLEARVQALEVGGGSEPSYPFTVTITDTNPTTGAYMVEWTADPGNVAGYTVYLKSPNGVTSSSWAPSQGRTYGDSGLYHSGTYELWVVAREPDDSDSDRQSNVVQIVKT